MLSAVYVDHADVRTTADEKFVKFTTIEAVDVSILHNPQGTTIIVCQV